MNESLSSEGTISFRLEHPRRGWLLDSSTYTFGPLSLPPLTAIIVKDSQDSTLRFQIDGIFDQQITIVVSNPNIEIQNLPVVIRWKRPLVDLFLNGVRVETLDIGD